MNISNMRDFSYIDSDDSTIEQPALSPSNSKNTSASEEEEEEEEEEIQYRQVPRSKSSRRWMV